LAEDEGKFAHRKLHDSQQGQDSHARGIGKRLEKL
jgi:hypothetical protein